MVSEIAKYCLSSKLYLKNAYHQAPFCKADCPYTAFEAGGKLYNFKRMPFNITNGVTRFQRILEKLIEKEELKGTFSYIDDVTICGWLQGKEACR